jgi:hypothetical protein
MMMMMIVEQTVHDARGARMSSSSFAGEVVSLASAVNVAILNAQRGLQELSVRLVSAPDAERKEALVKYCERTRHELLRLFVVVRWLGAMPQVQRVWRVLEHLFGVDAALRETADLLYWSRESLLSAAAPLFDVRTAVDVLARGTYSALPRCIDVSELAAVGVGAAPQPLLDVAQTARTLRRLEHAIHMRLLASRTPREAGHARVDRGRLLLRVDRAYAVALTLDSDEPTERWRVLEVRLLVATASSRLLRLGDAAESASIDELDAAVASSVPLPALRRLHAVLQQRIDAAPPDDGLLTVHAALMPLCTEMCIDALHEQARLLRQRVGRSLQLEYDRDVPALLVQYWCRDAQADDAADEAASAPTAGQFTRSTSTLNLRSSASLLKLALDTLNPAVAAAAAAAAAAAVAGAASTSSAFQRGRANAAQAAASGEGESAFCVTVHDGQLVVAHVPALPVDATTAHLIDGAVKRLDFGALLRHVVDARCHQSLTVCARAVSHVLAQQQPPPTPDDALPRASVAVLRATSGAATGDSAPPRLLLQLDGKTVCAVLRDRMSGALLASESLGDAAALLTPSWWNAALRVGANDAAAADQADLKVVQLGCVGLWSRAALEEMRLCALARGFANAFLRPAATSSTRWHQRRQSLLVRLADTHLDAFLRVCLDDAMQPAAQLVLVSRVAMQPSGAAADTDDAAQLGVASDFGDRLVRCTPLAVAATAASAAATSASGDNRRRRRLNADDAWIANAVVVAQAAAWDADFDAQLELAGVQFAHYLPDERTMSLKLNGGRRLGPNGVTARCSVKHLAAAGAIEWRVEHDLGDLQLAECALAPSEIQSAFLQQRECAMGLTVWRFSREAYAERGVLRTGLLAARVLAAVANLRRVVRAQSTVALVEAGDTGVRVALNDGALRATLCWRSDSRRHAHASAHVETSDAALDRVFGAALQALLGDVDARGERLVGSHSLLVAHLAALGPLARALDRLQSEFGDVRVLVLSLLGSVSVLVLLRQQSGVLLQSVNSLCNLRFSDAAAGTPLVAGLVPWARLLDEKSALLATPCSDADVFDRVVALRRFLTAVQRLADVARLLSSVRDVSVSVDNQGRRVSFATAAGSQAFCVGAKGAITLLLDRGQGREFAVTTGEIDDAACAVRSVMALLDASTFLPATLLDDALAHLNRGAATLLLSPTVNGVAVSGVASDSHNFSLRLALRYGDGADQRSVVLELSGESGAWVWSFAQLRAPLAFAPIELTDGAGQRNLGFFDNLCEAQRQLAAQIQ